MDEYFLHHLLRIFGAPILAMLSKPKYRYFSSIVALKLALGSVFVLLIPVENFALYSFALMVNSLLCFHLLLYKPAFSITWSRQRLDAFTGWGCLLFLANAVYYMCTLGELLLNMVYKTKISTFSEGYFGVMYALQVAQFALLIGVIGIDGIITRIRRAPIYFSGIPSRSVRVRNIYDRVISWVNSVGRNGFEK